MVIVAKQNVQDRHSGKVPCTLWEGDYCFFFLPKVNGTEWSAHFEKAAAVPAREVLVLVCWFWEANRTLGASTRGRDMWFEAEY